ncbi:hypothetical protein FRC11_000751, partial [Ceratobasidium sp. 423]
LSSQASWTGSWDNLIEAAGIPSTTKNYSDVAPLSSPSPPSSSGIDSTSDFSLVDGASSACGPSTKEASSSPSPTAQTKLETIETPQIVPPAPVALPPNITYTITQESVPEPLREIIEYTPLGTKMVHTSSHKLQMLEDDPLYVELIKDPEAVKVKTWRRKLKRLYFYQDIKVGKLLTQICQAFIDKFDYRQTYKTRAKELLTKWEPLARSSD